MGPDILLPGLLLGGSTALQMAGEKSRQREQRRILNRALDDTAKTQQQGAQMVLDQGNKLTGAARQAALADQEAQTLAQTQRDLGGVMAPNGGAAIIDTAGSPGAVSTDFIKAKADKALSEGTRLMDVAREAAKTRAPGHVLTSEGQQVADLTSRLGSMYGSNRNMAGAAQLDADQVDTPWYGKLGNLAQKAATIYFAANGLPSSAAATDFSLPTAGAKLGDTAAETFWNPQGSPVRFGSTSPRIRFSG